jgi:GntR family transcriptional regulator
MFIHLNMASITGRTAASLRQVNTGSGMPLHRQVEQRLRRLLSRRDFQKGALLPDELTIANRLGVSRGTVRTALARLVQDGLLERKAGVGTRMVRQPAESGIAAWRSFSREMARKGIRVETFRSGFRTGPATVRVARALQVKTGAPVNRLDRVRGWDGCPVLHSRSWLHPRLRLNRRQPLSRPLYEVIRTETGAVADHAREELSAVRAGRTLARRLGVKPGEPLLLRCHTVFDAGGRPIEFAEVHYVSARFTLTLDLRREEA